MDIMSKQMMVIYEADKVIAITHRKDLILFVLNSLLYYKQINAKQRKQMKEGKENAGRTKQT